MRRAVQSLLLVVAVMTQAAGPVDILVQGAEGPEVADLIAALGPAPELVQVGPCRFWLGRIGPHRVAVSLTGQALINCTIATVLGIEELHPRIIINQGTSGAQIPGLALHDIIVGRRCLDYSSFTTPVRGAGEGSRPLTWRPRAQRLRRVGEDRLEEFPEGFAGDGELLQLALRVPAGSGRVLAGTIGSAHEVNLELDRVRWSHDQFGLDVEEMESGHVAALAHAYGLRYIAFRVVSDAPYAGVPFQPAAAHTTARFTRAFLERLPALDPAPARPPP